MQTERNCTAVSLAAGLILSTAGLSTAHAAVIINEIDYDQPGKDNAEFIEIFNTGTSPVALDDFRIDLINGSNSAVYRSIDLSGFQIESHGYFVICGDSGNVENCDYSFTSASSWLQNGAPDAVALFENDVLHDSIAYEGLLSPYTEGESPALSDSNTEIFSLSRLPGGTDSDNNRLDFEQGCLTPGTANIAGTGDCSVARISPVPLPATAWLFGTGILGLAGFVRRK